MTIPPANRWWPGFWAQLEEVDSPVRRVDFFVFALITGFGAVQFFYAQPGTEFLWDDVFYGDSARALAEHGFYGLNGYPETNMPPGVSGMLALLYLGCGYSHAVFLRAISVTGTLGFIVSYELLRCQTPRGVAAAICLLLISSGIYFEGVTCYVASCYPYFFTGMSTLLVARKFEGAKGFTARTWWGALLATLMVASLMFASAGIAFLGAIVASTGVMFLRDRRLALARVRTYLAVLLVGAGVQGLWMTKARTESSAGIAALEWPVAGFPHSYVAQLKVKRGNYPEMGLATPRDLLQRVVENSYQYSNLTSRLLFERWDYFSWIASVALGALVLSFAGWCYSVWLTGGGLQDWYFAGYGLIFLLWPWDPELRFFLPVASLACLYMWRGGTGVVLLARRKPFTLGAALLGGGILLTITAWLWMHEVRITGHLPHARLQKLFFVMGLVSGVGGTWVVWASKSRPRWISGFLRWMAEPGSTSRIGPLRALELLGLLALVGLTVQGLRMQLHIGQANQDPNSLMNRVPADAKAGAWIRSHTDTNAVIMARQVPTVCHYSNRRVIWFPPSSNPQLLMEGTLKHKVNFVIVVRREYSYYLPADEESFAGLLNAYPSAFRLVYETPEIKVFEVMRDLPRPAGLPLGSSVNGSGGRAVDIYTVPTNWGGGNQRYDLLNPSHDLAAIPEKRAEKSSRGERRQFFGWRSWSSWNLRV